jgi:hypothetical protein
VPDGLTSSGAKPDPIVAPWERAPVDVGSRRQPGVSTTGRESARTDGSDVTPLPRHALHAALLWLLRLATLLAALSAIVLGAHGLYVYLNAGDGVLGTDRDGAEMFLAVDVPSQLVGIVTWCSAMALSSWAVPVSLIFGGGLLLWIREYSSRARNAGPP